MARRRGVSRVDGRVKTGHDERQATQAAERCGIRMWCFGQWWGAGRSPGEPGAGVPRTRNPWRAAETGAARRRPFIPERLLLARWNQNQGCVSIAKLEYDRVNREGKGMPIIIALPSLRSGIWSELKLNFHI